MTKMRVAILGSGLMGHGIAQVFACAGHETRITDPSAKTLRDILARIGANLDDLDLDRGALGRIRVCETLEQAVAGAQFVTEAAPEDLSLKQELFERVERVASPDAILASNTSVIPSTQVMHRVRRKARALGTHWWNPPYLVPLVEVVRTAATSDDVVAATMALMASIGKQPAEVKKDIPGFIGNRLQHALWREAISLVENGVCDAATVDAVVKSSFGRRLAVLGPLENSDMVGVDLTQSIHRYVLPHLDRSTVPSPLLDRMVDDGKLGFKTGEGFYAWSAESRAGLRRTVANHLKASLSTPALSGV
jgi:3-hydroxybutyryl-CoA dehydrogenase